MCVLWMGEVASTVVSKFKQDDQVNNSKSSVYLRPASSVSMSVDAVAKPNNLFQMTCAQDNPCKQRGL